MTLLMLSLVLYCLSLILKYLSKRLINDIIDAILSVVLPLTQVDTANIAEKEIYLEYRKAEKCKYERFQNFGSIYVPYDHFQIGAYYIKW